MACSAWPFSRLGKQITRAGRVETTEDPMKNTPHCLVSFSFELQGHLSYRISQAASHCGRGPELSAYDIVGGNETISLVTEPIHTKQTGLGAYRGTS